MRVTGPGSVRADPGVPDCATLQTALMSNIPQTPPRRLTLSSSDRKIGGVCGGIAEYFSIDPTLVRVITVVLALCFGGGLLAYLLAWVIMPKV